jgi:hypothetical protein
MYDDNRYESTFTQVRFITSKRQSTCASSWRAASHPTILSPPMPHMQNSYIGSPGHRDARKTKDRKDGHQMLLPELSKENATLPAPGCRDDVLQAPRITGVSFDRSPSRSRTTLIVYPDTTSSRAICEHNISAIV